MHTREVSPPHNPVALSQVPAVWHRSEAVHTTGLPPVHAPVWQVSVWVQALPSLHAVPLAFAGFVVGNSRGYGLLTR